VETGPIEKAESQKQLLQVQHFTSKLQHTHLFVKLILIHSNELFATKSWCLCIFMACIELRSSSICTSLCCTVLVPFDMPARCVCMHYEQLLLSARCAHTCSCATCVRSVYAVHTFLSASRNVTLCATPAVTAAVYQLQCKQVAAGLGVTALISNVLVAGANKVKSIADEEEESLYGAKIQVDATEVRIYIHTYIECTASHHILKLQYTIYIVVNTFQVLLRSALGYAYTRSYSSA
jgi:hypothetical protein